MMTMLVVKTTQFIIGRNERFTADDAVKTKTSLFKFESPIKFKSLFTVGPLLCLELLIIIWKKQRCLLTL